MGDQTNDGKHVLLTPETCDCDKNQDDRQCPVCDWGLSVCAKCGGGEVDLVGTICPGKKHLPRFAGVRELAEKIVEVVKAFNSEDRNDSQARNTREHAVEIIEEAIIGVVRLIVV